MTGVKDHRHEPETTTGPGVLGNSFDQTWKITPGGGLKESTRVSIRP